MTKKDWIGIAYVSTWVVLWGTIGSFVDYPLLQANIYSPGSLGQYSTFVLLAIISIIAAIKVFPKIVK